MLLLRSKELYMVLLSANSAVDELLISNPCLTRCCSSKWYGFTNEQASGFSSLTLSKDLEEAAEHNVSCLVQVCFLFPHEHKVELRGKSTLKQPHQKATSTTTYSSQ